MNCENNEHHTKIDDETQSSSKLLIEISRRDNFNHIRTIVENKNQLNYFREHDHISTAQLQHNGLTMLFLALENNSELLFGCLKHLNTMHTFYSHIRFNYDQALIDNISAQFGLNNSSIKELFLILYACMDTAYNGVRTEVLKFLEYWIVDETIATSIFRQILHHWPWTNRTKYYFLSVIFTKYNFYKLLEAENAEPILFIKGILLSLQYRNLISSGQVLVITLWHQMIEELYGEMVNVLANGTDFECKMCINHWLKCFPTKTTLYNRLRLNRIDLLHATEYQYLLKNNGLRLILFRHCFKNDFDKHVAIKEIDQLIGQFHLNANTNHKILLYDVLIAQTLQSSDDIPHNLQHLIGFFKINMHLECSTLRHNILRTLPNLFYFLAANIKANNHTTDIKVFFQTMQLELIQFGIKQIAYQPIIFSIRFYEILLKTVYGSKDDHLIKSFEPHKSRLLKEFLIDQNVWDLLSLDHYNQLLALIHNDFNDVRDIACDLLIRFFSSNWQQSEWHGILQITDINQCSYVHLLARIECTISSNSKLYRLLKDLLNRYHIDYDDPLMKTKNGQHFFAIINSLNEFYEQLIKSSEKFEWYHQSIDDHIREDIEVIKNISNLLLQLIQSNIDDDDGSPSFEKMDDGLQLLVQHSAYQSECVYDNKKFLLMSIWLSLKACCDLASTIGTFLLAHNKLTNKQKLKHYISNCLDISIKVLLKCRHKGAIEAAGLSLGRLIASITTIQSTGHHDISSIILENVENIFEIIRRTDTTRRAAGFSILIHHLVKNDKAPNRPLLNYVMTMLMDRATKLSQSPQRLNRDNVLAAVLHFLCVLVKDGELKTALTTYMSSIFEIALSTIESNEWTVRNAALQLLGAIVPKLVGQRQFFENDHIEWEPVYTTYNEIMIKNQKIHQIILNVLSEQHTNTNSPIVRVVLLEMLSRLEILSATEQYSCFVRYCQIFYEILKNDQEKLRRLAAKCLARFTEIHEIPGFLKNTIKTIFNTIDENFKHGLILAVKFQLEKYESDCRFLIENGKDQLFMEIRAVINEHCTLNNHSFLVKFYLLDLYIYLDFSIYDDLVLDSQFGRSHLKQCDIEQILDENNSKAINQFGFDVWRQQIKRVYCNYENDPEVEI